MWQSISRNLFIFCDKKIKLKPTSFCQYCPGYFTHLLRQIWTYWQELWFGQQGGGGGSYCGEGGDIDEEGGERGGGVWLGFAEVPEIRIFSYNEENQL